jgi:hypothetical protein
MIWLDFITGGRMRSGERSTIHAFNRASVADSSSTHYD